MSNDDVGSLEILNIAAIMPGRRTRIFNEVLIIFRDREERDRVQSFAPNLKGQKGAGIRLHIADHLQGDFKLLEEHGNAVRAKYGMDVKLAINFDDLSRGLAISIRLPKSSKWHKVRPAQAMESKKPEKRRRSDACTCAKRMKGEAQWKWMNSGRSC